MKIKSIGLALVLFICFFNIKAQSIGDTVVVQVLDYQNSSRNIIANFPTNGNISYEKVIMRYAMRCKNGLVSPPIAGQTNIGCGEWDYSCNTYIEEPSKIDSTLAIIDKYLVYPDTNTSGNYSSIPTFYGYPIIQKKITVQSVIAEDTATIGNGVLQDSSIINSIGNGGKSFVLLTANELSGAGLMAGSIDRLGLTNLGVTSKLYNFKIKMKASAISSLSSIDTSTVGNMQEVYFHNFTVLPGLNIIPFYNSFTWNGTSNILVELSYKGNSNGARLILECSSTSAIETMAESNDYSFNLMQGNYLEANSYKGISGTGSRTVEAWIKTTIGNKEIVSWGSLASGQKFSFRLTSAGNLRLEVQGGNIIGTRSVNDGQWHHVALTFNGTSTTNTKFYIDGVRDNASSGTAIAMNTGQDLNVQISKGFHNRYWNGEIDDVRIWSIDLPDTTIFDWRFRNIDSTHPNFSDFKLQYNASSKSALITDSSPNGNNGQFYSTNSFIPFLGGAHFKNFKALNIKPNISLYQGMYNNTISNDTLTDTTFFEPYVITENSIYQNGGTIYSDSIIKTVFSYWPVNNVVYNANGTINSTIISSNPTSLTNTSLPYYKRNATKIEIMSFVTPYGINLDLGIAGKAWYFDVSDYMPILEGNKRLTLERGGQSQEEMDISFLFIVGTPPSDIKAIDQIWPVSMRSYTDIIANTYFAPINYSLDTSARTYKLRSMITGHGQQGEFIPRNHFININGGPIDFNYTVWKECADNPIYPQGGTWIYDRAGWCPGMATDLFEFDVTNLIGASNTVGIDYGVSAASGDSRYIVNNQIVSYGPPNHTLDARITEVLSPTDYTEYGKSNPVCNNAEITIQNSGAAMVTSLVIEYWINSGIKSTYTWSGTLNFMEKSNVILPTGSQFWAQLNSGSGNKFYANILSTNGVVDNYSYNNQISREFNSAAVWVPNIFINFITNSAANESSYNLKDNSGAIIFQRNNMTNTTNYKDTFNLANGCYSFNVFDTDGDGMSFFANNDGIGQVALREVGGSVTGFNAAYGNGFTYNFTVAGSTVGLDEINLNSSLTVYPNPVSETLFIETTGLNNSNWTIYDRQGKRLKNGELNVQNHYAQFSINVSALSEGLYFIHFEREGQVTSKKFVIKK